MYKPGIYKVVTDVKWGPRCENDALNSRQTDKLALLKTQYRQGSCKVGRGVKFQTTQSIQFGFKKLRFCFRVRMCSKLKLVKAMYMHVFACIWTVYDSRQ